MERFETHLGYNYNPEWLVSLSDEELAKEIRDAESWDADLLRELCYRADMIDEWDNEESESVAYRAAEILGVEI